jgi:hypothetical protein
MLGPAPYWLPVIIPETTFPLEITRAHLAHIGQPIFFSFVYESMNNKAGHPICLEIGAPDVGCICSDSLYGEEKCFRSSFL